MPYCGLIARDRGTGVGIVTLDFPSGLREERERQRRRPRLRVAGERQRPCEGDQRFGGRHGVPADVVVHEEVENRRHLDEVTQADEPVRAEPLRAEELDEGVQHDWKGAT